MTTVHIIACPTLSGLIFPHCRQVNDCELLSPRRRGGWRGCNLSLISSPRDYFDTYKRTPGKGSIALISLCQVRLRLSLMEESGPDFRYASWGGVPLPKITQFGLQFHWKLRRHSFLYEWDGVMGQTSSLDLNRLACTKVCVPTWVVSIAMVNG